jgi:voltage-gated potassium channel
VCAAFFVDFVINLKHAENRVKYFFTWGWIDLLSSIPAVDWLRVGRFARLVRIVRVLRALKAMQILVTHLVSRRITSAFYSIVAVSFSIVVVGALAVLHFEIDADGSIRTAGDALWWAMTTITTVGYGDIYPVTPEGKLVAAVLMTAGVGLFGSLSGVIAGWFVTPAEPKPQSELAQLRASVEELRATVERLSLR